MTILSTVSLPTDPTLLAELDAAGWSHELLYEADETVKGIQFRWKVDSLMGFRFYADEDWRSHMREFVKFAAILGIQTTPPGMVLVPESAIRNAIQVCQWHINSTRMQKDTEVAPLVLDTRIVLENILAASLSKDSPSGAPSAESEAKSDA